MAKQKVTVAVATSEDLFCLTYGDDDNFFIVQASSKKQAKERWLANRQTQLGITDLQASKISVVKLEMVDNVVDWENQPD